VTNLYRVQAKEFPKVQTSFTRGMPPTIVSCLRVVCVSCMRVVCVSCPSVVCGQLHVEKLLSPCASMWCTRRLTCCDLSDLLWGGAAQKLKDKNDKEIDSIRIDSWSEDTIADFFKERLG